MSKMKNLCIRNSTAEFLIFSKQAGENSIEVRVEDDSVWLAQKLIAVLFEVTAPTVSEHLANIYQQGELTQEATVRNFQIVQKEGNREVARNVDYYNQTTAGRGLRKKCETKSLAEKYSIPLLSLIDIRLVQSEPDITNIPGIETALEGTAGSQFVDMAYPMGCLSFRGCFPGGRNFQDQIFLE